MNWKSLRKGSGVYKCKTKNGSVSYRVRFMENGQALQKVFPATTDAEAIKAGRRLIAAFFTGTPVSPTTWADLVAELLPVYEKKRRATYVSFEYITRLHLLPFLNEHAPLVSSQNPEVLWIHYKAEKTGLKLFNHHKHFQRLCTHAFKIGLLKTKPELEFDKAREDVREPGQVVTQTEFDSLVENADPVWRDRIILGWYTGMRPGEIRCLEKSRVDFEAGVIRLRAEDTKTNTAREFAVHPAAMGVLRRLGTDSGSLYFFPNRKDHGRPISPDSRRWSALVKLCEIERHITPHDLRHTFVTRSLLDNIPPLVLCFAIGMSLQEMQKTYMHMTAEDTRVLFQKDWYRAGLHG